MDSLAISIIKQDFHFQQIAFLMYLYLISWVAFISSFNVWIIFEYVKINQLMN